MPETTSQGKYASLHYRLTHEEWTEIIKILNLSELKVLYYLRTLDPFGDRFQDARTKNIAASVGISQRSVQRAVLRLQDLGLIDLEITEFKFRFKSRHEDRLATPMSLPRHPDRDRDTDVAIASPVSPPRHPCRDRSSEPSLDKGSRSLQTIHTLKTDQTPTPDPNPVCVENKQEEEIQGSTSQETMVNSVVAAHVPKASNPTTPENDSLTEILQRAENLGVRLGDRKLKAAIAAHPTRLETAVEALSEKSPNVRYPTRFLEKALLEGWEPETKQNIAFSLWYDEARRQDCGVLGGELLDGVQWVFDHYGDRHRWDELKALSWEDLKAKLNPSPVRDYSDVLAAIDCEILRLRWTPEQVQNFLARTFETSKRSQLSDEQLLELLALLEVEEAD